MRVWRRRHDELLEPLDADDLRGLRVLLCNWRDSAHPQAGGAELYCREVAERLVASGCHVTLLAAAVPGRPAVEDVEGVRVLRRGSALTVYVHAALHMLRERRRVDAVVDFQNGIPFFAPVFAGRRTAVVAVVHHVHQDQFALHFPSAAARLGRFLEGPVSRVVYRRTPVAVVSPSTREDVRRRLRFTSDLHVVPNGVTPQAARPTGGGSAEGPPRIVLVTRLVPQKRVERVVEAMPHLLRRFPDLHLDVIGRGPSEASIAAAARRSGVADRVTLHGYLDDGARDELLSRAWLTVTASVAEGWGLTVVEANAAGVPCVAYDVPGLRDAVVPRRTGWLVPPGGTLAETVVEALVELSDPAARARTAAACRAWAAGFTWAGTAARLAALLLSERRRIEHRVDRRRTTDLSTVAHVAAEVVPGAGGRLARGLRATDVVSEAPDGSATALLVGADEEGARSALQRSGLPESVGLRLALGADMLVPASAATVPAGRPREGSA